MIRTPPTGATRSRRQGTNARLIEATRQVERAERRERLVARARGASPRILLGLVVAGLAIGAGVWLWRKAQEPRWTGLQTIRVRTEGRVGAREAARLSGFVAGRNLLSQDLDAAQKRLQAHPWIAGVEISRSWPHGIEIELRERHPVARLADGKWISRDGVILDPRGSLSLPMLASAQPGRTRSDSAAWKRALSALEGMNAAGRADLEVRLVRGGSLEIRQGAGEPVALVDVAGWKTGLARWSVLRQELGEHWRTFSEIDLRHGSCAALRRAQGGT